MEFQRELEASLEAISSHSKELLAWLKSNGKPQASQNELPKDPFDGCDAYTQATRRKLTEASAKLLQLSIRPQEFLEHLQNGYQNLTCLRWLVELDILKYIPHNTTISYADLASKAGVPPLQLRSIARMAICNGFLEEPEANQVRHSRISALFAHDESYLGWAKWMANYSVPAAYKLTDATRLWGETVAKDQTAFNLGMDVKVPFFDHLRQTPDMKDAFAGYMKNVTSNETWGLQHAVSGFDWASLPQGAKVVDVGGSLGHASIAIAKEHTHLNFVIEDLPETVAGARTELANNKSVEDSVKSRISFLEHDFFTPQPIHDADVYFLRMICHDWPDNEAKKILSHIRAALKPGAQIVIMDTILPQPGTISVLQEQQLRVRDLTMMEVFNAKERELEDWDALVKSAGLEIAHLEQPRNSVMGLLAVRAPASTPPLTRTQSLEPASLAAVPASISPTQTKPVLIVGAGPAGLFLAQALKKVGIDFRVFERDPHMDSRPQGYRLKLESDAANSLKQWLPDDAYQAFESSCAITTVGETDFNPFNGNVIKSRAGGGLSGPLGLHATFTVDRKAFRTQLMTGIENKITFGKELAYYKVRPDGTVNAEFKDGTNVEGCFLAGADGLHSIVRKTCIPNHRLVDTGAACIYGKTVMTPEILARFPEKGLRWMTIASDSAPMLQSCLIGDSPITLLLEPIRFSEATRAKHPDIAPDYIYWALIGPKERFGPSELTSIKSYVSLEQAARQAAKLSLDLTEEWHPSIRSVFELQDVTQASLIRVASTVPDMAPWDSQASVTVLGDACHPMSPCGGVGANTGLVDANALAKVLSAHKSKPTANAIAEFEAGMRQRALRNILRSEIGSKKMFGQKNLVDCQEFKL